jgi:predicted Zn-ribbon and HTH transcriptional regulator
MASEESDERRTSVSLPADLRDWLDAEARSRDVDRDRLLEGLVAAFRDVARDDEGSIDRLGGQEPDEVPDVVEERFDEQHEEFMDLVEDVRKRVIQVKRETDAKAPTDHDHEAIREDLETTANQCDELDEELVTLRGTVEALQEDLDAGFENYEDVLEYLADEIDRLDDRLETVARVLVEVRSEAQRQATRATRRAEVEELKRAANQHGVRSAACEECGESVDVALLTRPECPHCASTFSTVTPKRGFFGSHVLETGSRPALEARVTQGDGVDGADEDGLERLADEDTRDETTADAAAGFDALGDDDDDDDVFDDWTNAVEKTASREGDSS